MNILKATIYTCIISSLVLTSSCTGDLEDAVEEAVNELNDNAAAKLVGKWKSEVTKTTTFEFKDNGKVITNSHKALKGESKDLDAAIEISYKVSNTTDITFTSDKGDVTITFAVLTINDKDFLQLTVEGSSESYEKI